MPVPSTSTSQQSRRTFLQTGAAAATVWPATALAAGVNAGGSDAVKVGLVGCGGRGTGAASQALKADPYTRLVAMGDAFEDRLEGSLRNLKSQVDSNGEGPGASVEVDADHRFVGFDAYKHVIDASDVVILTSTPHFRPRHLRAAIEAGKHVFCEKPVAVDPAGVRSVLETTELARKKNLSLVSGLCWRYDPVIRATFEQLHSGIIGDVVAMQCSYCSGGVWEPRRTREQCENEMEYQLRNWYYYTWLSGDFNVEQHVHSLDKMQWTMHDETPVSVTASGGRQQRTDPRYGNIYDHFNVVYEYANGVKAFARCRHWRKSATDVSDHIYGTEGVVHINSGRTRIVDHKGKELWKFSGEKENMYQVEHNELFASIRKGVPINNGYYMSMSTMMAIAGRMSAYTGKTLTWEQCMNSKLDLSPESYDWGEAPTRDVAIPGETKFV